MFGIVRTAVAALVAGSLASLALPVTEAFARPVTLGRTETSTDYVSAGIGGIGSGPGTISVTGVSGNVRKAFLYWQGVDLGGSGQVYDNPDVTFAGAPVTGVSLGDSETNCWGAGSSRAFFADVTSLVTGNGSYTIDGLDAKPFHNGNGASLVVLFNDSNSANNRDLVFFEGNDSDVIQFDFPGESAGWSATLPNINYTGGTVLAQIHASDGQTFAGPGDGPVQFTGASTVTIPDTPQLWDGRSLANAGFSRAGLDGLWDIHTFDITGAFGEPGLQTIDFTGMLQTDDCHSLVVMMLDLDAGSAPCGNGRIDSGEACDPAAAGTSECPGNQSCLNDCSCGCTNDFQCNDGASCTIDSCDTGSGECLHESTCPTGNGCTDTCDVANDSCRLCGYPFRNDLCIANAVFVLQGALELRECELCTCDVDTSNTVTVTDALRILRRCVGLSVNLECPEIVGTIVGADAGTGFPFDR